MGRSGRRNVYLCSLVFPLFPPVQKTRVHKAIVAWIRRRLGEKSSCRNTSIFSSNPVDQFREKLPAPERKFGVISNKGTYIRLRLLEVDNFETLSKKLP
jgi:hypothetical protein